MRKLGILLFAILTSIGGYAVYLEFSGKAALSNRYSQVRDSEEKAWPVKVVKARRNYHPIYRTVFGTIKAPRTTPLSFRIAGCIQSVADRLEAGQTIRRHDVLARLDTRQANLDIRSARLAVEELVARKQEVKLNIAGLEKLQKLNEEQLALARASFERQQKLSGRGITSLKIIDEAKKVVSEATSRIVLNRNERAALEASLVTLEKQDAIAKEQLKSAELQLEHAVLLAPHNGTIDKTSIMKGMCVQPMRAVVDLIDTSTVEVVLELPIRIYSELLGNQLLDRAVNIFSGDILLGPARLAHILPTVNETTGFAKLIFKIETRKQLVAGQKIHARLLVRRLKDVIELPISALFADRYIYKIEGERLKEISVEPVARDAERVFVTDEIDDGDLILTSRIAQAAPGLLVRVLTTNGG